MAHVCVGETVLKLLPELPGSAPGHSEHTVKLNTILDKQSDVLSAVFPFNCIVNAVSVGK